MSIRLPDPFVINDAPGFTSADLIDNYPLLQDELQDGSVLQVKNGNQFWSLAITYPELFPTEYAVIIGAIEEAKRTGDYIDILLPHYSPFRVVGNTTLTNIASGFKGSTITITQTDNLGGTPFVGDLFQLSGDSKKVYRITSVDTSVANTWTLGLYPDLVIETTGAEKPVFNNILFQTVLSDWKTTSSIGVDGLYTGVGFNFREAK